MDAAEREGFFAGPTSPAASECIELHYTVECVGDPRTAAALLCREQSTAQWRRPGVDEDLRPKHAAHVVALEVEPLPGGFSLPLPVTPSGAVHRCRAVVRHPHINFGPRIANLLSAVLGEGVFHAEGVPIVRLERIVIPDAFADLFPGPRFGGEGLRKILGVHDRPLLIGVLKPNLGLAPQEMAELAYEGWVAGLDICKDDEMLANAWWSSTPERAEAIAEARERAELKTGKRKLYLANVTDDGDTVLPMHDLAVDAGADAVMVNPLVTGIGMVSALRGRSDVPIFVHLFPLLAALSRIPGYGVAPAVLLTLVRLAGADAAIFPAGGGRMMTDEATALASIRVCTAPLGSHKAMLPVPGGADIRDASFREVVSDDWGFVAGRAIFGHPEGPKAGLESTAPRWRRAR